MSDKFATVLTTWSVEDAHLARIRLADEDIDVHLADDLTVGMDWSLANAMRGVKVLVKQEDAERAREILNSEPLGESSSDAADSESSQESTAREFDNELENHDDDDREQSTCGLDSLRSWKHAVIWCMLAPTLLMPLIWISSLIAQLLHGFGIFGEH